MTASESSSGATVPLFGKGWDDRELVNAYDAALLEFHIHHPGPGSWLDKATAALAKGQPLPGANAFDTAWYSAAKEEEGASKNPRKRQRTEPKPPSKRNPYSNPAPSASRAESPTYAPASPGSREAAEGEVEEVLGEEDWDEGQEEEEEDGVEEPDLPWELEVPEEDEGEVEVGANGDEAQVLPPPAASWPGSAAVSHDEALGYAMHAQYWAGYWMGMARGAQQAQQQSRPAKRRQQAQPVANGLRR